MMLTVSYGVISIWWLGVCCQNILMGISGMVYMSSSFRLLAVESCDLPQAERDITASKAEQIYKTTTIFTQNGSKMLFWMKMVVILWICSVLQAIISFSAWEKSRDSGANSPKLEDM